jgi:hypothetical protein
MGILKNYSSAPCFRSTTWWSLQSAGTAPHDLNSRHLCVYMCANPKPVAFRRDQAPSFNDVVRCRATSAPGRRGCSLPRHRENEAREPMRPLRRPTRRRPFRQSNRVQLLLVFGPRIMRQEEVFHEKALGCATRSRDTCRSPFIGSYACVRVRRVRSEPPSRSVGWLPLGWSKSSLVRETHRSCRGLWSPWDAVVLRLGAYLRRRPTRGRRASRSRPRPGDRPRSDDSPSLFEALPGQSG